MQCPRCNWQNPARNTQCFSCHAPLTAAAPPARSAPAPARADAPVFPGIWPRLGASAIDAAAMLAAMVALVWATSLTYESLTGASSPPGLNVAAGLVGWLLPAFMDAWGNGSPGRRLLKQRVVNQQGAAPGLTSSLCRHTLKYTLYVALPGIFHHLQQMAFGERAVHNALAGTHVVSRLADPARVRLAISGARAVTRAGQFLFTALGAGVLLIIGIALGTNMAGDDGAAHPLRAEVVHLDRVAAPVRRLAENHYQRTQAFPASIEDIGMSEASLQASGFSKLEMNPVNGVLRFTIAGEPAAGDEPGLAGKHLVYLPELRSEKKGGGVRRWQCGSDDIARDDRPYSCRHDASAFAR